MRNYIFICKYYGGESFFSMFFFKFYSICDLDFVNIREVEKLLILLIDLNYYRYVGY